MYLIGVVQQACRAGGGGGGGGWGADRVQRALERGWGPELRWQRSPNLRLC